MRKTTDAVPHTTPNMVRNGAQPLGAQRAERLGEGLAKMHRSPSSRRVVASIRPSRIATVRSASAAMRGSCVTRTTVLPSAWSARRRSRISSPVRESRLPVGSSARIDARPTDERARDRDPLALAARELGRAVADALPEADALERVERHARAARARRPAGS